MHEIYIHTHNVCLPLWCSINSINIQRIDLLEKRKRRANCRQVIVLFVLTLSAFYGRISGCSRSLYECEERSGGRWFTCVAEENLRNSFKLIEQLSKRFAWISILSPTRLMLSFCQSHYIAAGTLGFSINVVSHCTLRRCYFLLIEHIICFTLTYSQDKRNNAREKHNKIFKIVLEQSIPFGLEFDCLLFVSFVVASLSCSSFPVHEETAK